MKISNVDIIPIFAPLAKRYDHRKVDLYGIDCRILYRIETDNGIVGSGDQRVRPWYEVNPDEGKISFMGKDVTRFPMYRRARLGMGYLSQEPSVFRGLTVEQNLNAILELSPMPTADRVRKRDELVEEFGLAKLLNSKAAVLSGGEKRRLEIARALIMEPRLILLDEPFSGVDPIAVSEIQQIIMKLTERGIGILLTDHNVRETLNTTDRSYIILDGRIIAHGDREQLLADPNARKYYLGERFEM